MKRSGTSDEPAAKRARAMGAAAAAGAAAAMSERKWTMYKPPPLPAQRGLVRSSPQEIDFVDTAINQAMDTTGVVTLINGIVQGTSVNQRIGKKVLMKSVQARVYFAANSAATSNVVTMLLVYDRLPRGALPAVTDILVAATPTANNNDSNSSRFKILARVTMSLHGTTAAPLCNGAQFLIEKYVKMTSTRELTFTTAATGGIGDISVGAVYCVTVGSTAAGTAAATCNGNFRVRYWDV